jgi:hypothetical protein
MPPCLTYRGCFSYRGFLCNRGCTRKGLGAVWDRGWLLGRDYLMYRGCIQDRGYYWDSRYAGWFQLLFRKFCCHEFSKCYSAVTTHKALGLSAAAESSRSTSTWSALAMSIIS